MSFKPFNPFTPPTPPSIDPGKPAVDKKGRPIDPAKQRRKEVLDFMFKPDLASGLSEMSEAHMTFLRLVCNIFLQTGLIDAAYPGVRDPRKLGLRSLLAYAAAGLEFTREGMPKVLLFSAFVGSMVAVVLGLFLFLLMLGTGGGYTWTAAPRQKRGSQGAQGS